MWRVAIILKSGEDYAENFETKEQCDDYILKNDVTKFMIAENGEIIETDKGVRK